MAFGGLKGTWTFTANSILASNAATLATGSSSVAVGDLIVVVCGEQTGLTCTGATDTLGNTYSAVNAGTNAATTISGRCFYSRVTVAGTNTNINVAATASANNVAIVAACFSGPFITSPLDTQPANNNNTDNATPFTCPATGTLAQAIELVIGWMAGTSGATWTASAPNTLANTAISQAVADTIVGYQVTNVTSTVSPAFAGTNPTASVQGTASFKADLTQTTFRNIEWMGDIPIAREFHVGLRTWLQATTARMPAPVATYMPGRVVDWGTVPPPDFPTGLRTWMEAAQQVPASLPFAQDDWPVPNASYYDISLRTFIAINPPLLATSPPPPILMPPLIVEWGVSDRTAFTPASIQYNAPLLTQPVVTRPFVQADWPVPPAPQRAADLRTFINDTPVQLIGKDKLPVRQQNWPLPLLVIETARTWLQSPATVGPLPFNQDSWPVPVAPDYSVSLRSFLASPGLPLISAPVQPPFSQDDWPLPVAAAQPVRTWTQSPTIATPVVAPNLMPGRVSEWGMWQSVPFIPADLLAKNIALQPTIVVDRPKNQYNWTLPQSAPSFSTAPITNLTLSLSVAVAVTYLFRAPSYSPQRTGPRFETWTASVNIALRAGPPPQKPFKQTDWPLTPAARQPDRTSQQSFPLELVGQDRLPVRQQDWPVSIAAYYDSSLRTLTVRSILSVPTVQPPFSQDDWPVPSAQRQADRTFQRAFPPTLVGQDQFPVRQQSWAVPIATDFSNALRSIGFRSPALDVVAGRPFVQSSWPLTPAASQPDRTFQRSFPRVLIGKDKLPVRQQDWPLPVAPRPAADLRTYIAQSPIRLIGKDRLPFRQMHWPVPLAPLEFHTLRSITQGRVIYGGEAVPVPPEPEPPPPEVIHSVRAHANAYYGVFYADEIKGRADFSRAKGSNDEEAAN